MRETSDQPKRRRLLWWVLPLLMLPFLLSCSTVGYYGQAAYGQARIMLQRRDIARLVTDPDTPEDLRGQLAAVQNIREFASARLGLPPGGSYRSYVELPPEADGGRRRAVVWNVVAAPELDVTPKVWCFPVAGCVSYRGYFSEARARKFAGRLARDGWDVDVAGASAYSTLGWFDDPVLSTVIDYPEVHLAGLLFHELAHQLVYVQDDSRFNESFARTVEIEGVKRWIEATGQDPATLEGYLDGKRREEKFVELVLSYRDRLQEMYTGDESPDRKRQRKGELFDDLARDYRQLRSSWGEDENAIGYDRWFERELNNARLVSVGVYHDFVPGFQALLEQHGGDLESFYTAVRELAELPPEEREARLR
ncbi:MAG: aminopeptidase [bacterium]|nr:aminopeptidase [bacterium]